MILIGGKRVSTFDLAISGKCRFVWCNVGGHLAGDAPDPGEELALVGLCVTHTIPHTV